jgi:O-antigen ligase
MFKETILQNREYNILSFLIFFLFIGYILGEAFINFILLINTVFISYLVCKKFIQVKLNYISISLLVIFYMYLVLLGIFKVDNSLFKNFSYIRFIALSLSIMILINSKNNKKFIYYSLLVLLFLISVDAIYQKNFDVNLLGTETQIQRRITGIFNDEEVLGSFLSKTFLLCAIFFECLKKSKFEYLIFYLSGVVILIATYVSAERLGIFTITIFFLASATLQLKKRIYQFYLLLLSFLILIIAISISEHLRINIIAKTLAQVGLTKTAQYISKDSQTYEDWKKLPCEDKIKCSDHIAVFFSDRFGIKSSNQSIYGAHYITAKKIWIDNFWFGAGVKSFIKNCDKEKYDLPDHPYNKFRCSSHPHSIYLQILSEIGLIGFISFLSLFILIFFKNLKMMFKSNKNLISFIGLIIIFLPLPSGNFFSTWYGSFLWIFLGLNLKNFLIKKS